jgi:hypothetical protein
MMPRQMFVRMTSDLFPSKTLMLAINGGKLFTGDADAPT